MTYLQENISLAKYSFYHTGGLARYFLEINKAEDFEETKEIIGDLGINDVIVWGAGSNILISDEGWEGLVVKNNYTKMEKKADGSWLIGSGMALPFVARKLAEVGYQGLERLASVPGSVGGGIRGNAEAWRQNISDCIREVVWFDWIEGEKIIKKKDCGFGYRTSVFKTRDDYSHGLIKEAIFDFKKVDCKDLINTIEADKKTRQNNQPDLPSCGCFFKNVLLDEENWGKIEKNLGKELLLDRKLGDLFSAGKLIDWAGYKDSCQGGACVSKVHANFIVNKGKATSQDIYDLYKKVYLGIKGKIGIELEPEVQIYGRFAKNSA